MHVTQFCGSCGTPIAGAARFCPSCGRPIGPAPFQPQQQAPSAPPPQAPPRPGGPPWKRFAAIAIGLAIVVGVVAALASPASDPEGPLLGLGTATAKNPEQARIVTTAEWGRAPADQVLVLLKDGLVRADAERIASTLGATIVGEVAFLGLYQLETAGRTGADLNAAVLRARATDGVAVALANQAVVSKDTPGTRCDPLADPSYLKGANARAYEIIGLRAAWDVVAAAGLPLSKVKVGILDEALYTPSGEFNGPAKVTGDKTTTQFKEADGSLFIGGQGHGTSVAGFVGANPGNGGISGVDGILGDKLELDVRDIYRQGDRYVRVGRSNPSDPTQVLSGTETYVARTFVDITRQIDGGATVINASFGPDHPESRNKWQSDTWRVFLSRMALAHPKVLFVAAAGNENGGLDGSNYSIGGHPLPNLMTVGSVDNDGARSSFSNYARGGDGEVTLAAPGNKVMLGVGPDGQPIVDSGTSFSTPQVAGAAALLRSLDPDLTAKDIKDILVATAAPGVLTKDAQGNEISHLVPKEIGGRVLRVDEAVLKVVNDLRTKRDPSAKPLTLAGLRALAAIDVSAAQKDPLNWTVTAKVPGVGASGTDVKFEWLGQGGPTGGTKHLGAADSLQWPYTFAAAQDGTAVTVTRLDTGACARVSFKAGGAVPPGAVAPSPVPTAARSQPATLRDVLERARVSLGWSDNAPLGMGRDVVGADQYVHVVRSGSTATRVILWARNLETVDYATGEFRSYVLFDRALGPTTYRGLLAFRDLKPNLQPIPGINRDTEGVGVFNATAGTYVFKAQASCECTVTIPQRELDALLDAAVALGFIPPGTLK